MYWRGILVILSILVGALLQMVGRNGGRFTEVIRWWVYFNCPYLAFTSCPIEGLLCFPARFVSLVEIPRNFVDCWTSLNPEKLLDHIKKNP
jgi:hypothetical protein